MERPSLADQRRGLLFERLFLCASSALASAFLSITCWRRLSRANMGLKPSQPQCVPEPVDAEQEKELLSAYCKIKELEASLGKLHFQKSDVETELAEVAKKLAAAQKVEESLRQLAKKALMESRLVLEQQKASHAEMTALRENTVELQKETDTLERALADSKGNLANIQRSLAAQTDDRKAAQRRVKELEVGLSSALASKAHTEAKSKDTLQRLEAKLKAAEAAKAKAEADLMTLKERMDVARGRVATIVEKNGTMQRQLEETEAALVDRTASLNQERQRRAATEPQLLKRVRELEAELKITRETARNQLRRTLSRSSIDLQHGQHTI